VTQPVDRDAPGVPKTPAQLQRALDALELGRQIREELLAARGGRLFPSAGRDLDQIRAGRTRELP